MKKILVIVLTLSNVLFLNSQSCIGIIAGYNSTSAADYTSVDGLDYNFSSLGHYQVGVTFNTGINKLIAFEPQLLYIQKGAYSDWGDEDFAKEYRNFIQIPLMLKIQMGTKKIRGYVGTGVAGEYDFSAKTEFTIDGVTETIEDEYRAYLDGSETIYDEYTFFDRSSLGIIGAAGLYYKLGPGNLLFEIRYDYEPFSYEYRSLLVSTGYMLNLGRAKR